MSIIGLLIVIYFMKGQFEFERPSRWRYFILPLYSLVMLFVTFKYSEVHLVDCLIILILGGLIGVFQGRTAEIQSDGTDDYVKIKGGWPYLIGWAAVFAVQLGVSLLLIHQRIDTAEIWHSLTDTILEDLLPFRKMQTGAHILWPFWALSGSSSLCYTLILGLRSPKFKKTIARGARKKARQQKNATK